MRVVNALLLAAVLLAVHATAEEPAPAEEGEGTQEPAPVEEGGGTEFMQHPLDLSSPELDQDPDEPYQPEIVDHDEHPAYDRDQISRGHAALWDHTAQEPRTREHGR
jgi:hypothetical protein